MAVGNSVAAGVDRFFHRIALHRSERSRQRSRAESLGPRERHEALTALRQRYATPEHLDGVDAFFPEPTVPNVRQRRVRRYGRRGEVVDLSWPSGYAPFEETVADDYLAHEPNRIAQARAFLRTDRRRPATIMVHGYLAGQYALEELAWPTPWLYRNGLDVVLAVLPFHANRASGLRPMFPNTDPRMTIEGFRQAMHDLRSLAAWLRDRGAPKVGMMGMSLGGYTTALAATVAELDFAVPFVPLASIADFARDNGRLVGDLGEQEEQHRLLEDVYAVVSPLSRPPRVPPSGRLVVAAQADRITPMSHAQRIADHFDAPLEVFSGGHLFQLGRNDGFRAIGRMLGRLGVLEKRRR